MKKLLLVPLLLLVFQAIPQVAGAVDVLQPVCGNTPGGTPQVCQDNEASSQENPIVGPSGVLTQVVNLLSLFVGVASVFVITLAGFRMIISQGNPESFGKARQAILFAVIGVVLAAVAQILVRYLLYKL